jgi:diguanylate cyclase (GGDEF)-like protein
MQMIAFDIRTLSFITTSMAFLFSIGLFAYGLPQKKYRGFLLFASASALFGIGFFLLGYRDYLSDFISIIFANMMLIVGMVFYLEGLRRFLSNEIAIHPVSIVSILAGIIIFFYFTYRVPSVNSRIIGISAIFTLISGLCAWELFNSDQKRSWRVPDLSTSFVFVFFCLFHLFRLIWTVGESPIQSFMSAGTVHAFGFISVMVLVAGSTFGFIWMVTKRLEHELNQLASLDPLTKILNRRGVDNLAAREFSKMARSATGLVTVLMDIDDFKQLNDKFGHVFGDKILIMVAKLLNHNLRPYDIFGRLGGDEFILILPNTELDKALTIVERLRKLIEDHVFEVHEKGYRITMSFGVAEATPQTRTLGDLFPLADKALYRSKHQGRNKVTVFLQEFDEPNEGIK